MRTKYLFLMLTTLTACVFEGPLEYKFLPPDDDVAMLQSGRYINHTSSELVFESEVVVLNSFYEGFNNDYLTVKNFEPKGNGTYSIESFVGIKREGATRPSSLILIMDQSGTYEGIDPFNVRSQAINKFLQDILQPNKFLVAGASRQGMLNQEPIEVYSSEFGNDWTGNSAYVFGLSQRTGGMNNILDAANQAIDLLIANPESGRRQVVLMVHSNDENSSTTLKNLILKAQSESVTFHVVSLGFKLNNGAYAQLCQETGGLFAACTTDKELIKVFSELERLINRETFVYKMKIRFKPTQNILQPGSGSEHTIQIKDPFLDKLYNPVYLKITIPS